MIFNKPGAGQLVDAVTVNTIEPDVVMQAQLWCGSSDATFTNAHLNPGLHHNVLASQMHTIARSRQYPCLFGGRF